MLPVTAQITKRFETAERSGRLVAFAKFTISDAFVVHNVQILQRDDGTLRISMPPQRRPDGSIVTDQSGFWRETCHPINSDMRSVIVSAIMDAYDREDIDDTEGGSGD